MRRIIYSLIVVAPLCFWAWTAWGQDSNPDTFVLFEPTASEGGALLIGLIDCQVTMTPGFAAFSPQSVVFPASSPNGGGNHPFLVTDSIVGIQGDVSLSATCRNPAGESTAALAASSFPLSIPGAPVLQD